MYTLLMVTVLFALLPLSQRLLDAVNDDTVTLRSVDVAPPPPPPPPKRLDSNSSSSSQSGVQLKSILPSVGLAPVSTGAGSGLANSVNLGLNDIDLTPKTSIAFNMKGVGFGSVGLDRPPIMLIRPKLQSDFLRRARIDQFEVEVLVRWRTDGSLSLISIEQIQYPNPELIVLVHDAIARVRYNTPTIEGVPVERYMRLQLTIHAE